MRIRLSLLVITFLVLSLTSFGQVGHWKFDNNFTDSSPNNIQGTLIGLPTFTTDKKEGTHAMSLSPSRAVDLGTPSAFPTGNTPRTIAAWAKSNNVSGSRMIAAFGTAAAGQAMYIGQEGNALVGGGWSTPYNIMVSDFWTSGTWHHIAMTYDGTTARLYADGVLVGSLVKSFNLVLSGAFIGKHLHTSGWWDGAIDDVRIYDRALSENEIAALVSGTSVPAAPTNATASAVSSSAINLSWSDESNNEDGFQIEQSTQPSTDFVPVHTTAPNATSYEVTGLNPSTQYYFRIRAINSDGASEFASASATTQAPPQPSGGLVGHWRLNGNINDDSGGGVTGTFIGSPTFETGGKEGSHALKTNGMNQAIDLGTPSHFPTGNAPRTITAWAKTNTLSGAHAIAAFGTTTAGQAMYIGQNGADLMAGGWSTVYEISSPGFWALNTWHHIAMTYDGTTAKLYADGVEVGSMTKAFNLVLTNAYIGKHLYSSGWWNGSIDDVRIYDRALTVQEIEQLAGVATGIPEVPTSLTATALSASQIELAWSDNATNETGFEISRSLLPDGDFAVLQAIAANSTSFVDTGLNSNTTYYYRIRALGATGNSDYTLAVGATTASPSGPVGHWRFDNNFTDASGNNRIGTAVNGASFNANSIQGSHSLALNGSGQYVNVVNDAGLPAGNSPRTLSAWALTNSVASGYRWVVSYGNDANGEAMYIGMYGSDLKVGSWGAPNTFHFGGAWSVGQWKHICLTYDGAIAKVYINGDEAASQAMSWNLVIDDFFIGRQINNSGEYWNGLIDDVRVYDRALTSAEIQALAATVPAPPAPSALTATIHGANQIALTWQANVVEVDHFEIERSPSLSGPFLLAGVVEANNTFIDSNVLPQIAYYYRVRAVKANVPSPYSNLVTTQIVDNFEAVWNGQVSVNEDNGILEKISSPGWDGAGAQSENWLSPNSNGNIAIYPSLNQPGSYIVGFSQPTLDYSITDIQFGIGLNTDGNRRIVAYESGVGSVDIGQWNDGDVLHISREGSSVKYYRNGVVLRTSPTDPADAYVAKVILHSGNTPTTRCSFWLPASRGLIPDAWEFRVLKALYDNLGGSNWTKKNNWATQGPINVTAAQMESWYGITTASGDITRIELASNNLIGQLPYSIGELQSLNWLILTENNIQGSIPVSIGNLTKLRRLDLGYNAISGTIPTEIGNLQLLDQLLLHYNQLTGEIPEQIGGLTNLVYLYLHRNNLSGAIPDLGNLTSMQYLAFHVNNLTGNFDWLGNMTAMRQFFYYGNPNLACTLPETIGNLTNMTHLAGGGWLDVDEFVHTKVTGQIPESIGNCTKLEWIYLDNSEFYGPIPTSLNNLVNLKGLFLFNNPGLGGDISSIGNLRKLQSLSISNTGIGGVLPGGIATSALTSVELTNSQVRGPLPASLANAPNLSTLHIGGLELTELPGWVSSFPKLQSLIVSNNELTGLPQFSGHPNKANLSIRVEDNALDFADLEGNFFPDGSHPFDNFEYVPQNPTMQLSFDVPLGDELVIDAPDGGIHGLYYWEKNIDGVWTEINELNESQDARSFRIPVVDISHGGVYRVRVTNSIVAGLVLESDQIHVNIGGAVDPVRSIIDNLAFQYKYDSRRRMTHKKVPGADWVYMVYDSRDRLVMTQDGNQRHHQDENGNPAPQWSWTKYDQLNRPVMMGIYTHNEPITQADMSALISTTVFYETRDINAGPHGYTSNIFHHEQFISENFEVLTITYYDDRFYESFVWADPFQYHGCDLDDQYAYAPVTDCQDKVSFPRLKGLVTATKTKVLGEEWETWLWSVNHYDDKGRVVQNISSNALGDYDRVTNRYDFVGKVLETKTVHNGYNYGEETVSRKFDYDHAGRLLKTWHRIGGSGNFKLLAANEYNELGQLVTKKLHSTNGTKFKQHVDYRYNIRGWVTRINNANLNTSDGGPQDYFGMEFGYNNDLGIGTFTPQYNGNISATKWSANLGLALPYLNEPTERAYKFTYDPMNRLREANYAAKAGSWTSSLAYREAMDYDLNGNILSLHRNNAKGATMDWLEYNYGTGGNKSNQLKSVTDYGILTKGFRDGNTSGDDYAYDGNGNLVLDKNKEISLIKYNSLNVTEQIDKSTGEKVKYIYDADGIKLAEEIYLAGAQTPAKRIDYVGPLVYENDTLKFIVHEEGKIVIPKDQSGPEYQYQIKDHLGNIRLTFTTKEKTEVFKATMEDTGIADYNNPRVQEMQHFGNLFETEIRNVNQWLNHTSNSIGNAIYLDGSENKTIGPYTMLKVYPGDTVKMEVFGKFENESSHSTMPLIDLLVALATPVQTAAIGFEGGANFVSSSFFDGLIPFLSSRGSASDVPAAYLNYILFDKDFNVVDLGFDRIDESAGFDVLQEATVSFDKMELERIIDRVGYLYVYVSNESEGSCVWMDDIKITYGHSPIVQFEDYYPFGLSISGTAFERGNDKYKGMVTADGTGLKDLGFRQYDAALGRFHAVDPLAELQADQSSYQYAGNNPVNQIDVLGLEADDHDKDKRKKRKEERMVNGKKVKVHNGFESKQQRRSERAANQRERQQARANRREQRQQRREEYANNKEGNNKGEAHASADKSSSNQSDQPDDPDPDPFRETKTQVASPSLRRDRELPGMLPESSSNRPPRFENSVTPPGTFDEPNNNGMSPLVYAASLGENVTDVEKYRQYLYSHLSTNEARALYQRMLVSRNYSYQTNRLKENLAALSNTSTSDDETLDQEDQPLTRQQLQADPRYAPLTTQSLRDKAQQACPGCAEYQRNIVAGNALEYAWSYWSGKPRNRFKNFRNDVRSQRVRPDFVYSKFEYGTNEDTGKPDVWEYDNGVFVEVKASQNEINLNSFNKQIWGELNALSKQKGSEVSDWTFGIGGKQAEDGVLSFCLVVTEDTEINLDIINEATQLGLTVFVAYAYENVATGGVVFSIPERKNFLELEGIHVILLPEQPSEGVQLDWDRAIPSWQLSNEYDESQP